jgi:hypothetical protein
VYRSQCRNRFCYERIRRSSSAAAHRRESLLSEIAVPVRRVTIDRRFVEGACFGGFPGTFRITRCPVAGFASIRRVALGVPCEMLESTSANEHLEILVFMLEPCELETELRRPSTAFGKFTTAALRNDCSSSLFFASRADIPASIHAFAVNLPDGYFCRISSATDRACGHCFARAFCHHKLGSKLALSPEQKSEIALNVD